MPVGIDYVDLAVNILLQVINNGSERSKKRKALLKVFKAIADAYKLDQEFRAEALSRFAGPRGGL